MKLMPDYRFELRHPDPIEAFQMTEERRWDNLDWPSWLHQAWNEDVDAPNSLYPDLLDQSFLTLRTKQGPQRVSWGNYILRYRQMDTQPGADPEYYLVRMHQSLFKMRYREYRELPSFFVWLRNWWRTAPW